MTTRFTRFVALMCMFATPAALAQTGSTPVALSDDRTAMQDVGARRGASTAGVRAEDEHPAEPRALNVIRGGATTQKAAPEAAAPRVGENTSAQTATEATPNEFQRFVAASLRHSLPIFGHSLFTQAPSTFAQSDRVPVTADYVVGPGDEVLIRAWGQVDIDARLAVDRTGDIYLAKVGSLHVAGLKYSQLHEYVKTTVGRVFKNFDLTVTLGQLRSIQVFVVGRAQNPGAYTVSSLSTLVNALFACGGPSPAGSMRRIELKRDGAVVTQFDLYDLLLKGDKSKDVGLMPGDVIFIPAVGPLVALDGSVNTPAVYELKQAETLAEAIEFAGGVSSVADGQNATVERILEHSRRSIEQFPLDKDGLSRPLQDGDLITFRSVSPKFANAVTLRGNVARPGRYPWHAGMRVHDLLPTREDVLTREYWMRQNAAGQNKDVRGMPEVNWEYALVSRTGNDDLTNRLLTFNLGKAIDDASSEDNLELQPGDIITVFSQADVRVPERKQSKYVVVEGEVKTAGTYRVAPGETLRQLVQRAGGLTPQSYLFAAQFTRKSTQVEQQARLDEMMTQLQRDAQRSSVLVAAKASGTDGKGVNEKQEMQQTMLNSMRQLKATGRIVLNLLPSDTEVTALPDFPLEDGDRFYVPSRSASISVAGEVVNPSTFLYTPRKRIADYVKQAGGPSPFADQGRTFVLRANGSIVDKKSNDGLLLMPGDAIVVPQRLPKTGILSGIKDWTQILSQFGIAAAAVSVLSRP